MDSSSSSTTSNEGIKMARKVIKLFLVLVLLGALMIWIMMPTKTFKLDWYVKIRARFNSTYFGNQGVRILIFTFPILLVAALSCVHLHLGNKLNHNDMQRSKNNRLAVWTRPVIVRGPLGILSWIELVFFVMFIALLIWSLTTYLHISFSYITAESLSKSGEKRWEAKLEATGLRLGLVGNICLAFLFFPVTRGSSILSLFGLTSEASIKYHIWLGHITMTVFTAHGLCYFIYWAATHQLSENQSESSGSNSRRPRSWTRPRVHYITTIFPIPEAERAIQIVLMGIRKESLKHLNKDDIDDFVASLGLLMDHAGTHPVNARSMEHIHRTLPNLYQRYNKAYERKFVAKSKAENAWNEFYRESNHSTDLSPMVKEKIDLMCGNVKDLMGTMLQDEIALSLLSDEAEKRRKRLLIDAKQTMLNRYYFLHEQASASANMVSPSQSRADYLKEKSIEIAHQEKRVKRAIEEMDEIDQLWYNCLAEHPIVDL